MRCDLIGQKFNSLTVLEKTDKRSNGKVVWKCQCDCGNITYVHTSNLRNGQVKSCGKCFNYLSLKSRIPKKHIDTEIDIIGNIYGSQKVLADSGERIYSYKLYNCECIKCHHQSKKTISDLKSLKSNYCGFCQVKNDLTGQQFGYLTVLGLAERKNRKTYWLCKCQCGNEVKIPSSNLTSGNSYSCGCLKRSKGEIEIENYLKSHQITYETEKKFGNCFYPNGQQPRFDFYLPDYNLLIEYDGQQHFQEVEIFKEPLNEIQSNDQFKNNWCQENHINLLRIPYTQFQNINMILDLEVK